MGEASGYYPWKQSLVNTEWGQPLVTTHGSSHWILPIEAVTGYYLWEQPLVTTHGSSHWLLPHGSSHLLLPWEQPLVITHGSSHWLLSMGAATGYYP